MSRIKEGDLQIMFREYLSSSIPRAQLATGEDQVAGRVGYE